MPEPEEAKGECGKCDRIRAEAQRLMAETVAAYQAGFVSIDQDMIAVCLPPVIKPSDGKILYPEMALALLVPEVVGAEVPWAIVAFDEISVYDTAALECAKVWNCKLVDRRLMLMEFKTPTGQMVHKYLRVIKLG